MIGSSATQYLKHMTKVTLLLPETLSLHIEVSFSFGGRLEEELTRINQVRSKFAFPQDKA